MSDTAAAAALADFIRNMPDIGKGGISAIREAHPEIDALEVDRDHLLIPSELRISHKHFFYDWRPIGLLSLILALHDWSHFTTSEIADWLERLNSTSDTTTRQCPTCQATLDYQAGIGTRRDWQGKYWVGGWFCTACQDGWCEDMPEPVAPTPPAENVYELVIIKNNNFHGGSSFHVGSVPPSKSIDTLKAEAEAIAGVPLQWKENTKHHFAFTWKNSRSHGRTRTTYSIVRTHPTPPEQSRDSAACECTAGQWCDACTHEGDLSMKADGGDAGLVENVLIEKFSPAELRLLCIETSFPYYDLTAPTHVGKCREMASHFQKNGSLSRLIQVMNKHKNGVIA